MLGSIYEEEDIATYTDVEAVLMANVDNETVMSKGVRRHARSNVQEVERLMREESRAKNERKARKNQSLKA